MRKLFIALSAIAAVGIAMPAMSGTAHAEKIVIKKGDRGHHYGWRHHHHHHTKIIIRRGHRHHHD
jgi:hypothetical protein